MENDWPSDEKVKNKVSRAIFKDRLIDQSDVKIEVVNGNVTLVGKVSSRDLKVFAEKAIEDILGVKQIYNQLTIKPNYGLIGGHLEWPQ